MQPADRVCRKGSPFLLAQRGKEVGVTPSADHESGRKLESATMVSSMLQWNLPISTCNGQGLTALFKQQNPSVARSQYNTDVLLSPKACIEVESDIWTQLGFAFD